MTPHELIRGIASPGTSWASSDQVRKVFAANRSTGSKPEIALRQRVHKLGLRYRVATRPLKTVRRRADLVFPSARVSVFVDGCFWHGCPEHFRWPKVHPEYWRTKIDSNRSRDREIDSLLALHGWLSVRIWEHADMDAAALDVAYTVKARRADR